MVFSGVFPIDAKDYDSLRDALAKLRLNDSAFTFEPETVAGPGLRLPLRLPGPPAHGDRPGAAGARVPARPHHHRAVVVYRVTDTQGETIEIDNPAKLPPVQKIASLEEPVLTCHIHGRTEDVGAILKLCQDRRGVQRDLKYIGTTPACRSPTTSPWPRWSSTSSTG